MDELSRLRAELARERLAREEANKRAQIEQHRREEVEEKVRPQTLREYLEGCHALNSGIRVETDRSLTTKGDTTKPEGRIYPKRIVQDPNFSAKQEEVWELLASSGFHTRRAFPSSHQLDYIKTVLPRITSEIDLRRFQSNVVENAVEKLIEEAYNDPHVRDSLGLEGTITFESHTHLGFDQTISKSVERLSINEPLRTPKPKTGSQTRGKGNRADQFCIYRTSGGRRVPVLAVEYKAPHKLFEQEATTGLASEVQPDCDVINVSGEGFSFASRRLAAAVVTQLFSYMIGKEIRYGYVCTGEVFVFLYIPDNPRIVYQSICVPNKDALVNEDTWLHRTAVAQVFAFVLQALRGEPPSLRWSDEAKRLDTWAVEYEDVLRDIPPTVRKEPRVSPYKPSKWTACTRSPIRTRARCKLDDQTTSRRDDPDDDPGDDNGEGPSSPSPTDRGSQSGRGRRGEPAKNTSRRRRGGEGGEAGAQSDTRSSIQHRPFCTQECLLGLAYGGPIDSKCPNVSSHGVGHIRAARFRHLLGTQIATDRDADADCIPLYLSGSAGALFKVRLSSYGYTLVAKGMESHQVAHLRHEQLVYNRLRPIQGRHIPVHLGLIHVDLPLYYDGGVFHHLLLLSWGGRPLLDCIEQVDPKSIVSAVQAAFGEIHQLQVLHCDAEPRNVLYNPENGRLIIVDFERAILDPYQPLAPISVNHAGYKKQADPRFPAEAFIREWEFASAHVSRWLSLRRNQLGLPCSAAVSTLQAPLESKGGRYVASSLAQDV